MGNAAPLPAPLPDWAVALTQNIREANRLPAEPALAGSFLPKEARMSSQPGKRILFVALAAMIVLTAGTAFGAAPGYGAVAGQGARFTLGAGCGRRPRMAPANARIARLAAPIRAFVQHS